MPALPDGFTLRPGGLDDIDALQAIERHCFRASQSAEQYRRELTSPQCHTLVVEFQGHVVGYAMANLVLDEAHVPSVGIAEPYRRVGLGRALMVRMLELVRAHGARHVYLEVRRTNRAARRLYEGLGFELLSIRRDYYWDPPDDGMVMRLAFDGPTPAVP
ncbi:MAG: ribosomal protein S18-alanine N-acetyltransferase [Armatimonadetes bacterium]|nr:ribosomal protein S18-alanine N-acetyltransferase [Armatimonadota bacterium]